MDSLGALQSLASKLASFLPNLLLRRMYPKPYFSSNIHINMGDYTPSMYLETDGSGRLMGLAIAITNFLPFQMEINFSEMDIRISGNGVTNASINKTIDVQRLSRQQLTLPDLNLPPEIVRNRITARNSHDPLFEYNITYRVRHQLWTFNHAVRLSTYVRIFGNNSINPKSKAKSAKPKQP